MSPRKPRDRVLRPKHFVEQDTFFTPIVTSEVTLRPEHLAADDAFPGAAATRGKNLMEVIEEYEKTGKVGKTSLADLLRAFDVLHEAFGDDIPAPYRSSGRNITIPAEFVSLLYAALTGEWTIQKYNNDRSKKSEELIARCRELMGQKGTIYEDNASEAARRIAKDDGYIEDKDPEVYRLYWQNLAKRAREKK
jgi:hypothetical protein